VSLQLLYYAYLILTLIARFVVKGHSKTPSPHLLLARQESIDRVMSELPDSQSRQQEKLRQELLIRDNHQCVVSGFYDDNNRARANLSIADLDAAEFASLEAARIIPFSLAIFRETEVRNHHYHVLYN
jgi:hypothetical protein